MVAQSTAAPERQRSPLKSRPPLPIATACVVAAAVGAAMLAKALWGAAIPAGPIVALVATAGAGTVMLASLARAYPHDRFGLCNAITLGRAALVAVLAVLALSPGLLVEPHTAWTALALALSALALDGLDGAMARRAGLVSAFGARFDMEVDTALALVLAALLCLSGKLGVWVLALGLMRPAFVVAGSALPRLRRDLPQAQWRKAICVVQIGALTALLAPVINGMSAVIVAATALALLTAGFARDVAWLWRSR